MNGIDYGVKLQTSTEPIERELTFSNNNILSFENQTFLSRPVDAESTVINGTLDNPLDIFLNYHNSNVIQYNSIVNGELTEYFRVDRNFKIYPKGISSPTALSTYVPKVTVDPKWIKRDRSNLIDPNYSPTDKFSIVSKQHVQDAFQNIDLNKLVPIGAELTPTTNDVTLMDPLYTTQIPFHPHIVEDQFIYVRLSETMPETPNTIWNNQGVIDITP